MKLTRLSIQKLPGIQDPFTLEDLGDGLHVIVGPNGSGKTSLCRAVQAVLFPTRQGSAPIEVVADLSLGHAQLHVERDRERIVWQRDGIVGPPPELPEPRLGDCFVLSVRDLIPPEDTSDSAFASEIRRLMAGGFDVSKVASEAFTLAPRHGRGTERELREARRTVAEIRGELRLLARDEDRLEALKKQRDESLAAQRLLEPLRVARELARESRALDREQKELATQPQELSLLRGDEKERLDEIARETAELNDELARVSREADDAAAEATECELPQGAITPETLSEWTARARGWERDEADLATAEREIREADAARRSALKGLDPEVDFEQVPNLEPVALRRLDDYLRRSRELEAERRSLDSEITRLASQPPPPPGATLEEAALLLRRLLVVQQTRPSALGSLAGVLLGLGLAGLAYWLLKREPQIAFAVAGVGVTLLAVVLVQFLRTEWLVRRTTKALSALQVTSVDPRDAAGMRARLQEIEEAQARFRLAQERSLEREALESRRDELEGRFSALEKERNDLRLRIGFDPGRGDLDASVVTHAILRIQQTEETLAVANERSRTLRFRSARLERQFREFFEAIGEPMAIDHHAAAARLDELRHRSDRLRRAEERERTARARRESLSSRLNGLDERMRALWATIRVAPYDTHELQERLSRLPGFHELRHSVEHRSARVRELTADLAATPKLRSLRFDEVERRIQTCEKTVERLGGLEHEIGAITARVEQARTSDRLEVAMVRVRDLEDSLTRKRHETLQKAAGAWLLRNVRSQHDRNRRPKVLDRAMSLFGRFTRHRFELTLDTEHDVPTFRARETGSGRGLALSQLSDATRVQLLLAVRLAFAEHVEASYQVKLPLFLDEVLATTDPDRFQAITEALQLIATEDRRQVFYLSSSEHDVGRFRRFLGSHENEIRIIDLAEVRKLARAVPDARSLEMPLFTEVPSPDGLSAEEYGVAIGVPPIHRDRPASMIHLFHLLRDDLQSLAVLLRGGLETIGHWRAYVRAGVEHRLLADQVAAHLTARCDLAEEFLEQWRIGRGKAIDREVLEEAGVSAHYIDRFAELAVELRGSASHFITALEAKRDVRTLRYRTRDRERLRAHLLEHGYLDLRDTLDSATIQSHVLSAMEHHIDRGRLTASEITEYLRRFSVQKSS